MTESTADEREKLEREKKRAARTKHEDALFHQVIAAGLTKPVREHRFLADRRFRWDLSWPGYMVAVEVNGGIWMGVDKDGNRRGAHGGGAAAERDAEKLSLAAIAGWRVLSVVPRQIASGEALRWIEAALTGGLAAARVQSPEPADQAPQPPGPAPYRRRFVG